MTTPGTFGKNTDTEMSKLESVVVGLLVGFACPLLTFVYGWWTPAGLYLSGFPLPEHAIAPVALTGLGIGCLLDAVFLRHWIEKFYTADWRLMVLVYLALGVVACGLCMGVPLGTFALGIAAGVYIGRRMRHCRAEGACAAAAFRRGALFVATVTTAMALPIGILALQSEKEILRWLETGCGLNPNSLAGTGGFILVGVLCAVLFVMQYGCSRLAGHLAFGIGRGRHDNPQ
jgi:lysylphosphatidylglycerol synthetase-like protein (DUF2156 family)